MRSDVLTVSLNALWEHPRGSNCFTTQHISFLYHPTYPATTFSHSSSLFFLSALNIQLPTLSQKKACTRTSDESL